MFRKKLNHFVSEIDKFLKRFDRAHPELSPSQQAEIKKAQRIGDLRDHKHAVNPAQDWWDQAK